MTVLVLLNILLTWLCWRWSQQAFENENEFSGWLNLVFSAWNAAAAANQIF